MVDWLVPDYFMVPGTHARARNSNMNNRNVIGIWELFNRVTPSVSRPIFPISAAIHKAFFTCVNYKSSFRFQVGWGKIDQVVGMKYM